MKPIRFDRKFIKEQFGLFSRFVKFLFPYRARWIAILLLSIFGALLGLINPYLAKLVVDKAIGNRDLKIFVILAVLGGAVFVVTGLLNGLKQYLERHVKLKVKFDLNKKIFRHINSLSFSWFQGRTTGGLLYKISYDIERVKDFITEVPPRAVFLFPKLLFTLFIILRLNWKMAVFTLCLTPFLYLPSYYFTKRRKLIWKRLIKNSERIFEVLQEAFSHIYLIKVLGKETVQTRKYLGRLIENIKIELDSARLETFDNFIARVAHKIIIGLIAFYGGYQVIKGQMSLGSLTAILVYLGQLVGIQAGFVNFFQTIVLGLVSCQRISGILDEKSNIIEDKRAREIVFKKGQVVFNNVSFGYLPERPILKDLNFLIEGGRHVALVAPSGYGKTTLLNLIVRLYDPWQGRVLIDGVDIKNVRLSVLKSQIGIALQETFLFNDTIKNNILYGKDDANEQDVIASSRISLVDEFTKVLSDGYDTRIGENACKLSEGQKQKIAIARAVIRRPRILILDEGMSSIDSASEERILSNIKENQKDLTLITVSHRLSTVMRSDLVYFLSSPGKIASGVGEELLQNNKEFYNLFKAQVRNGVLI